MNKILKEAMNKKQNHQITYEEFMNIALYEPEKGYYQKENQKIGQKGDFYTSSSVGTVYGEVIASVFCSFVKNNLVGLTFVEVGGGNGRFANSFLTYCKKNEPTVYSKLNYILVDESNYHRSLQKEMLIEHSNVKFYSGLTEMQQEVEGVIFSNELFDALPVRVVEFQNESWHEVVLTYNEEDKLVERYTEIDEIKIIEFLHRHQFHGKNGQRLEVPLVMEKVFDNMQSKLIKGMIITVDYGFNREEWDAPHRLKGSLRGYHQHEMKTNVLDLIGEMDLTTHLHWDELKHIGLQKEIDQVYFSTQRNALLDFGILNWLIQHAQVNPFSEEYKQNRAVQSLIMPGGISDSFQLLIQTKGIANDLKQEINELISLNEYK